MGSRVRNDLCDLLVMSLSSHVVILMTVSWGLYFLLRLEKHHPVELCSPAFVSIKVKRETLSGISVPCIVRRGGNLNFKKQTRILSWIDWILAQRFPTPIPFSG